MQVVEDLSRVEQLPRFLIPICKSWFNKANPAGETLFIDIFSN